MSEAVREITREELVAENRDLRVMSREMQSHIEYLKAELEEVQRNNADLPAEPIKVAGMLISASYTRENCMSGLKYEKSVYDKAQLRQIAEHLLVYCNNAEVE